MNKDDISNAALFTADESNPRRFELFQNAVLGGKRTPDAPALKSHVFERNLKTIRYAAIVVLLTNLFWLIKDIFGGGHMGLCFGAGLYAVLASILFSCYMLLLPKLAYNRPESLVRYSFLSYYICLICAVTVLGVTKNMQLLRAGIEPSMTGLALSTCYLFIIVLAPLPSRHDSFLLFGVFFAMYLLPALLPGRELYSLAQQGIVRLCMAVAYWYVRDVNLALADSIQRLSVLSFTDSLTNTFNRRALDVYWNSICKNALASDVGVLIFDIDDFKKYNDRYTHSRGNDVLVGVCGAAQSVLRGNDSFLFRYGGEEFVVLLPDHTEEAVLHCAERIRQAIYDANIVRDDGSRFDRITVTVGCAREKVDEAGNKDCIVHADEQLYIGKNAGKNCVVFRDKIYR